MKDSPFAVSVRSAFAASALVVALTAACYAQTGRPARVTEFPIAYPNNPQTSDGRGCHVSGGAASKMGSTHEITFDERRKGDLWISGQNYDALVRVAADGRMHFRQMPEGSGPHGIEFDAEGRLWVTLEFHGRVVALDGEGKTVADYDVRLDCSGCPEKINTHPHGLGVGADGRTVWFTGKGTGTVGRITPDGRVQHFALPTVGSVPIYIKAGPDGNMWVTELVGNKIARVTPDGWVTEYAIPTANSRPIAIVPGPDGNMWFSEEAGNKVARIDK
jgi:virginiamycin B lyase